MTRDLILVAISLFTWGLGETAFLSFQPLYLQQLGADPLRIGAIIGSYGLAASLVHIPAGYLADKIGRRPMMWAAWIIGALTTWGMAMTTSLPIFVTVMLIYSMTTFVVAPLNSYVASASGKWSVGRILTLVSAFFNAGAILGPLLGGMIGERYGYRAIFLFAASLFLLSTVIILFIHSQPTDSPQQEEKSDNLFKNQRFLIFIFAYFFATFAMYLPQPLSPNFLQNEHGLRLAQIGRLYSINGLGIVALNLVLGQLNARLGFFIGQVAVWVFALMLWKGNGIPVYALAFFLLGGFRSARSLAIAHIRSIVKKSNMGLAFGFAETTTALALFIAPPLAGYLYDLHPTRIYTVSLGVIALSLLVSVVLSTELLFPRNVKEKLPSEEAV